VASPIMVCCGKYTFVLLIHTLTLSLL